MPELPEVETVARGLAAMLTGRRLVRVATARGDLRAPFPLNFGQRLDGRRVRAIRRRAKYILVELDQDLIWLIHLGMTGRFTVFPPKSPQPLDDPHDHVRFDTDDGAHVRFNDARRFGVMDLLHASELTTHRLLAGLGPEPFDPTLDVASFSASLAGKRTPIKSALLDQRVIAGLGNIYVSEALFLAGISPKRLAGSVAGARAARLLPAIRNVLEAAIAAGGSTLRDFAGASGELGYFQHRFTVYDREGKKCPGCDCDVAVTGGIQRMVQAGRSTFYCPRKQR
ncbi:MAG: Formamidopyrimidine-DNA glycosylase [Rhodospirillales bacterium]|nr:Formamidopyrimidine-DNA glycosylase [Rhodospirillales bacterium]